MGDRRKRRSCRTSLDHNWLKYKTQKWEIKRTPKSGRQHACWIISKRSKSLRTKLMEFQTSVVSQATKYTAAVSPQLLDTKLPLKRLQKSTPRMAQLSASMATQFAHVHQTRSENMLSSET